MQPATGDWTDATEQERALINEMKADGFYPTPPYQHGSEWQVSFWQGKTRYRGTGSTRTAALESAAKKAKKQDA